MTQQVILIDIDGTLADTTHRHQYIQSVGAERLGVVLRRVPR